MRFYVVTPIYAWLSHIKRDFVLYFVRMVIEFNADFFNAVSIFKFTSIELSPKVLSLSRGKFYDLLCDP